MNINKEILSLYQEILSKNKKIIIELNLVKLEDTTYSNLDYDKDGTQLDSVNKPLLDDLNAAAKSVGVTATITTASTGHSLKTKDGNDSRHPSKTAVDISILNGLGSGGATNSSNGNAQFRSLGNRLKDALVSMGYSLNVESGNDKSVLWQTNTGGNHFNHLHVSNQSDQASSNPTTNSNTDNSTGKITTDTEDKDSMETDLIKSIFSKILPESVEKKRLSNNIIENIKRIKKLL